MTKFVSTLATGNKFLNFHFLSFLAISYFIFFSSIYRKSISYNFITDLSEFRIVDPPEGFLWNSSTAAVKSKRSVTENPSSPLNVLHSINKRQAEGDCKYINVSCSSQMCGTRPSLGIWTGLPNLEGRYPWHATLFLNGEYLCGATLIAPQWLIASANCIRNLK